MWMTTWPKISGPVLVRSHFSAYWLIELTNEGKFGWTTSPRPPQWQQHTNTMLPGDTIGKRATGRPRLVFRVLGTRRPEQTSHEADSRIYEARPSGREQNKTSDGRERERSIFFRGYRYTLRDQDTTWPAGYEPHTGEITGGLFTRWITGALPGWV